MTELSPETETKIKEASFYIGRLIGGAMFFALLAFVIYSILGWCGLAVLTYKQVIGLMAVARLLQATYSE